jgi:mono/diheme cytochrome c family protein
MQLVLGLGLTGYLLPWDQKGYWATNVATNLATLVPGVGKELQQLAVGGNAYGHHTLTRFFAMHAGILPALLVVVLIGHIFLFRRHGITAKITPGRPDEFFWPKQVLFDAIGCLVLTLVVLLLVIHFDVFGLVRGKLPAEHLGADLGAPADPSEQYSAARPEWYYLFLFQLLKYFPGNSEVIGAIVIPGAVLGIFVLMPFIGYFDIGHRFNQAFTVLVLLAAVGLTGMALVDDYFVPVAQRLGWTADEDGKPRHPQWLFRATRTNESGETEAVDTFASRLTASREFLEAREAAEHEARRTRELIARRELLPDGSLSDERLIPRQGAAHLLRNDPLTHGPRLFGRHCASCHTYFDPSGKSPWKFANIVQSPRVGRDGKVLRDGAGSPQYEDVEPSGAPNLFGFASRAWIKGLLDKEQIVAVSHFAPERSPDPKVASDSEHSDNHQRAIYAPYFGNTNLRSGRMAAWVAQHDELLKDDPARSDDDVDCIAAALSAQAKLPAQREIDEKDTELIRRGIGLIEQNCARGCHKFGQRGQLGLAPDLTGYGSYEWMLGLVSDPEHERFYRMENDRMPSFAKNLDRPEENNLSIRELSLIVDWLRGQYYRPGDEAPILAHSEDEANAAVRLARTTSDPWTAIVGAGPPQPKSDEQKAQRLFAANCAACHNHTS